MHGQNGRFRGSDIKLCLGYFELCWSSAWSFSRLFFLLRSCCDGQRWRRGRALGVRWPDAPAPGPAAVERGIGSVTRPSDEGRVSETARPRGRAGHGAWGFDSGPGDRAPAGPLPHGPLSDRAGRGAASFLPRDRKSLSPLGSPEDRSGAVNWLSHTRGLSADAATPPAMAVRPGSVGSAAAQNTMGRSLNRFTNTAWITGPGRALCPGQCRLGGVTPALGLALRRTQVEPATDFELKWGKLRRFGFDLTLH